MASTMSSSNFLAPPKNHTDQRRSYSSDSSCSLPPSPTPSEISDKKEHLSPDGNGTRSNCSGYGSSMSGSAEPDQHVTLRCDICPKEHPGLIGGNGSKVQEIRDRHQCAVHFPDTPAHPGGSKSHLHTNEVSISGRFPDAVLALRGLRDMIPFRFSFAVPNYPGLVVEESMRKLESIFGVKSKPETSAGSSRINVEGPQCKGTLDGTQTLMKFFGLPDGTHVTTKIGVHLHTQSEIFSLCNAQAWLAELGNFGGVTIQFPQKTSQDKQTVTFTGELHNVAAAWMIFMSMLPVTVRVFVSGAVGQQQPYSEELQVQFLPPRSETKNSNRPHQYVELRTFEGNLDQLAVAFNAVIGQRPTTSTLGLPTTADRLRKVGLDLFADLAVPLYKNQPGHANLSRIPRRSVMPSIPAVAQLPLPPMESWYHPRWMGPPHEMRLPHPPPPPVQMEAPRACRHGCCYAKDRVTCGSRHAYELDRRQPVADYRTATLHHPGYDLPALNQPWTTDASFQTHSKFEPLLRAREQAVVRQPLGVSERLVGRHSLVAGEGLSRIPHDNRGGFPSRQPAYGQLISDNSACHMGMDSGLSLHHDDWFAADHY